MSDVMWLALEDKTRVRSNKALFWSVLITALFGIYNILNIHALFLLGLFVMAISLLLCNDEELFLVTSFLIPNIMMIKESKSFFAIVSYYVLFINIKRLIKKRTLKIDVFVFFHFISVLITTILHFQLDVALSAIKTIVFLTYISSFFENPKSLGTQYKEKIIWYYILGLVANVLFGIAFYLYQDKTIFSNLFAGIRNDRNYFSAMLSFGIAISLAMVRLKKKRTGAYLVCTLFFLFFGFVSQSRTFLLSLFFSVVILLSFLRRERTRKILLAIAVALFLGNILYGDKVVIPLLERFLDDDVLTGSGRTDSWKYFISLTFSSPLRGIFGNGFGGQYLTDINFVEHNTYIQAISTVGTLGAILLLSMYISIYSKLFRTKQRKDLYAYMPLLTTLFFNAFINSLYSLQFDVSLFIGCLLIDLATTKKVDNREIKLGFS